MSAPLAGSALDPSAVARLLPGAEELFSEFQGYNGDCGQFAELSALHIVTGLALTASDLNAIVQRDIHETWASSNGAEPLESIAKDLDSLHVLYTQFPFPGPDNWLHTVQTEAGYQPVIVEVANGQSLAGDETGLHYHFITVVGLMKSGNLLCCDGDNVRRDGAHLLCEYTVNMLQGAAPCGLIVLKYPQSDPYGYVVQADGSIVYNATKIHLIGAVADFVKSHNLQEECLHAEQYYQGSDYSVTPFTNGVVLVWSAQDQAILLNHAGEVIAKLLG